MVWRAEKLPGVTETWTEVWRQGSPGPAGGWPEGEGGKDKQHEGSELRLGSQSGTLGSQRFLHLSLACVGGGGSALGNKPNKKLMHVWLIRWARTSLEETRVAIISSLLEKETQITWSRITSEARDYRFLFWVILDSEKSKRKGSCGEEGERETDFVSSSHGQSHPILSREMISPSPYPVWIISSLCSISQLLMQLWLLSNWGMTAPIMMTPNSFEKHFVQHPKNVPPGQHHHYCQRHIKTYLAENIIKYKIQCNHFLP